MKSSCKALDLGNFGGEGVGVEVGLGWDEWGIVFFVCVCVTWSCCTHVMYATLLPTLLPPLPFLILFLPFYHFLKGG